MESNSFNYRTEYGNRINRRQLGTKTAKWAGGILGFLTIADIVIIHATIPGYNDPPPGASGLELLETGTIFASSEAMRRRIEKDYGVRLVNPSDELNQELKLNGLNEAQSPAKKWDRVSLRELQESLRALPAHFYNPRADVSGNVLPLRIALDGSQSVKLTDEQSKEKSIEAIGYCNCGEGSSPIIVFRRQNINGLWPNQNDTKKLMTHELAHYVTAPDINRYAKNIAAPLGLFTERDLHDVFASEITITRTPNLTDKGAPYREDIVVPYKQRVNLERQHPELVFISEWYAVENALLEMYRGGSEQEAKKYEQEVLSTRPVNIEIPDVVEGVANPIHAPIKVVRASVIDTDFKEKTHIGYGAKNFHEFFSVAAEYYSQGKRTFVKQYRKFLGEEKTEQFYQLLRIHLFSGRTIK